MKSKKVTTLEAIRAFYIGNELLPEIFKISEKQRQKKIKGALKKIKTKAAKLSDKQLLTYHLDKWHPRYDNYFNSSWELREIDLKDCGAWPRMGGLPDEITRGSVVDTAGRILALLEDKKRLTFKTSRTLYIEEMMKYAEDISAHVPIVVVQDGVIRHNKLIKPAQRKLYKKCKYDIDDGNHRAIAMALLGKKKILALVGKRIYKNPLLYS